jgi:hypothetical protein
MARLLILLAVVFIIWYGIRWWKSKPPKKASSKENKPIDKKTRMTYGLWGLAAVLILLTVSGRAHWITGAIGALIPLIKGGFPYLQRLLPFALQWRKSQAQQSQLKGEWLQLKVNPMSGTIDGTVLKGNLEGRKLSDLSEPELKTLLARCLENELKSAQLLGAYLQHSYGQQWQASFADVLQQHTSHSKGGAEFNQSSHSGSMSQKEAYEILGVDENASKEEVIKAYKSIMQKVHPDRGGSDYLTRLVSDAKELLIKKFK